MKNLIFCYDFFSKSMVVQIPFLTSTRLNDATYKKELRESAKNWEICQVVRFLRIDLHIHPLLQDGIMILYRKNPNPATSTKNSRVQKLFKPPDFSFTQCPNIVIGRDNRTKRLFLVWRWFRMQNVRPGHPPTRHQGLAGRAGGTWREQPHPGLARHRYRENSVWRAKKIKVSSS